MLCVSIDTCCSLQLARSSSEKAIGGLCNTTREAFMPKGEWQLDWKLKKETEIPIDSVAFHVHIVKVTEGVSSVKVRKRDSVLRTWRLFQITRVS